MEVPDPAGAPPGWEVGDLGPSAPLVPFRQPPAAAPDVTGRTVVGWTPSAGTYGMGGPGLLALDLGGEHLVVTLWGAASWARVDGRLLEDLRWSEHGRPAPWSEGDADPLTGRVVTGLATTASSLTLTFADGGALTISPDAEDRPPFPGTGEPRAFGPDDDLATAVVLSPTLEIWV